MKGANNGQYIRNVTRGNPMTPTKQDKELREALYTLLKTDTRADTYVIPYRVMDIIVEFITADRKRAALEARLNEVQNAYEHWINGRKFISSYFRDRIALLFNTKESKDE